MKLLFLYLAVFQFIFFLGCAQQQYDSYVDFGTKSYVVQASKPKIQILSFLTWGNDKSVEPPQIIGGEDSLIGKIKYPEISKRAGVQGLILIEFTIDTLGRATNVRIITSIFPECDDSFIKAIVDQQYIPAKYKSTPINQLMRAAAKFELVDD